MLVYRAPARVSSSIVHLLDYRLLCLSSEVEVIKINMFFFFSLFFPADAFENKLRKTSKRETDAFENKLREVQNVRPYCG